MELKEQIEEFTSILSQLPISPDEMEALAENGFDDPESLRFLDVKTLTELGIEQPEEVFQAVQELLASFEYEEGEEGDEGEEGEEGEGMYEYLAEQQLGGEFEQEAIDAANHKQGLNIEIKTPKVITQAMIFQTLQFQQAKLSNSGGANYSKTMKGSNLTTALGKLTHLHLNNKRISQIGDEMQQVCKNLKVLYLFDNLITRIDGLLNLKNIIQLSLYNNRIQQIEGLDGLPSLRKLYLEKNMIERLEGLTNCRQLEELYLSHQEIQNDFTFDEYSLAAIAGSLRYLDLCDSRVRESQPLYYLERLEVLILKRNRIEDFETHVCPMLQTMTSLQQLDLSENPVNGLPKYRDQIIILTGSRLQEIDNKKVTQQERSYLMQLVQRKTRHVIGQDKKEESKKSLGSQGAFEISGKNKQIHQQTEQYYAAMAGGSTDDTQNQFYSPIDDVKHVLKPRTNIANQSFQNNAYMKKRSVNLNSNNDFTGAGMSHMPTKHVPGGSSKLGR